MLLTTKAQYFNAPGQDASSAFAHDWKIMERKCTRPIYRMPEILSTKEHYGQTLPMRDKRTCQVTSEDTWKHMEVDTVMRTRDFNIEINSKSKVGSFKFSKTFTLERAVLQ